MSVSFEGKIFKKGNNKIPKSSYLILSYKKNHSVYKSDSIQHSKETGEFTLIGSPIENANIDFKFLELRINNNLVNNVLWFIIKDTPEGKLELSPKQFKSKVHLGHYLSSVLTLGILGCIFLKNKNKTLNRIATNLHIAQKDLCNLSVLGTILDSLEDINDAKYLKETYKTFQQVRKELDTPKEDEDLKKTFKELEVKFISLGDQNFTKALELKNEYGNLEKIETEIKALHSLTDEFGSITTIKNKLSSPQETRIPNHESERLQRELDDFGTPEERRILLSLKRSFRGNIDELSRALSDIDRLQREYGSIDEIRDKLTKASYPLKRQEEIEDKFGSWDGLFRTIDKYKSIESLGDSDLHRILELKSNYGNIEKARNDLQDYQQLKDNHGSLELIKQKLQKLEDISRLETTIEQQKSQLNRWQALSPNTSLERLEQLRDLKEDKIQEGLEFEKRIENVLYKLSDNMMSSDVEWRPQYKVDDKKRIDFLVRFKNKHNKQLTIVIECKRHSKEVSELDNFNVNEGTEESAKKLLSGGVEQLCEYYEQVNAHIGLLVTNSKIWNLDKTGVQSVISRINKDCIKGYMNLLLVHESSFETLMTIIKYINNTFEPDEEVIHTYAERHSYYNNPNVSKLALILRDGLHASDKKLDLLRKKLSNMSKDASQAIKYHDEYLKLMKELYEGIQNFLIESNFYSEEPALLEQGSIEIEENETESGE